MFNDQYDFDVVADTLEEAITKGKEQYPIGIVVLKARANSFYQNNGRKV